MRWKGPDGRLHVPAPTAEITKMTTDLVICFPRLALEDLFQNDGDGLSGLLLLYSCLLIVIGLVDWNPTIIIAAGLISIPPILLALRITRPPIIQPGMRLPMQTGTRYITGQSTSTNNACANSNGASSAHGRNALGIPSSRGPWALFAICVIMGTALSFWISNSDGSLAPILAFGLLAIPLWILASQYLSGMVVSCQ